MQYVRTYVRTCTVHVMYNPAHKQYYLGRSAKMSTSDMMDWKLVIVQRLRQRQQRESGGFTELINSCRLLWWGGIIHPTIKEDSIIL